MTMNRRTFLQFGTVAAGLTLSGCGLASQQAVEPTKSSSLLSVEAVSQPDEPVWRLLNRAGYGPRPGEYQAAIDMGMDAWITEQLEPQGIQDRAASLMLARLAFYHSDLATMASFDPDDGLRELLWASLGRQIHSNRQLYEVMVEFWSDHFAIYPRKDRKMIYLKIWDDREVIRPNALGTFRDLVSASVYSPAMLHYLDNTRNFAEHPNENYARELLELHTLGVNGGYDQADVGEMASLLSGLTVRQRGRQAGTVYLNGAQHDDDDQTILTKRYSGASGEAAIAEMINDLATHPSTAAHIATKLVRRFVADDPPPALVGEVKAIFLESDGDIKRMLRHILLSPEFKNGPTKFKRPIQLVASSLRALDADVGPSRRLFEHLTKMGQIPFMWPAPDGYPDRAEAWVSNQLPRWNFLHDLVAGSIRGVRIDFAGLVQQEGHDLVDQISILLYGQTVSMPERRALQAYVESATERIGRRKAVREMMTLMLAGPRFQLT